MENRSNALEQILLFLVRAAIYLVPGVALILGGEEIFGFRPFASTFYPNVTWKHFVFRSLVEIMLGLWGVLAWLQPRYRPRFSWVLAAYALFILVLAVANAAGMRPAYSFWGTYERMEGLIGHLHLFAFLLVLTSVFDSEKLWRWLFLVSIGVCLLVCAGGIWQLYLAVLKARGEFDGQPFLQQMPAASMGKSYFRVDARIANPVYVAVYMLFHAFVAAWLSVRTSNAAGRWLLRGVTVLCVVMLVATGTKIAFIGLAIGAALVALLVFARAEDSLVRRRSGVALGVVGTLVAAVLLVLWLKPGLFAYVGLERRFVAVGESLNARLRLWEMVWQAFLENPVLGWGQENFGYVFNKYYHPSLFHKEVPLWWDHPHNVFFGWLVAAGLPGLLGYLAVLGVGFWYVWRRDVGLSVTEKSLLTGMLVGYCVFNSSQLDNLTSYVVFFSVLGYLHFRAHPPRAHVASRVPMGLAAGGAVAALPLIVVAIYSVNTVNVRPAAALAKGHAYKARALLAADGMAEPHPGDFPEMMRHFREAASAGAMGLSQVRDQIAKAALEILEKPTVDAGVKRLISSLAIEEMEKEVDENPGNAHDLWYLGRLYSYVGRQEEAVATLERALAISPLRQKFMFEIADVYLLLGKRAEAMQLVRRGLDAWPASVDAQLHVLVCAILTGDRQTEDEILALRRGASRGNIFHINQKVVDAWLGVGRHADAIAFLEPIVQGWISVFPGGPMPRRARARFIALGKAYIQAGMSQKAQDLAAEMQRIESKPRPNRRP